MGAAVGWFVGTVLALLVGFFVWTPLLGGNDAAVFIACFLTGLVASGVGMVLGAELLD